MWHNNLTVSRTNASNDAQNCWAILNGIAGWKRVAVNDADGVTNLFVMLCAARANGNQVDVYIVADQIERAVLK